MNTKAKAPKRPNVHQLYIPDDLWSKSKPILAPLGLSRSQFVQLIFQSLIDSEAKPLAEVQGNLFESMIKAAKRRGKM